MEDGEHWPFEGSLNYDTVLQLDWFCRKQEEWVEVPYMLLFISLWDTPDLCLKGADLGVKSSAASCSLTLPLYPGLPTEQVESQGTLPGGAASVSVEFQQSQLWLRLFRGSKKYIEDFMGLTLPYELTWRDVMYVLGQTLTSDLRIQLLGEATGFGDEWLEGT